MRGVLHSLIFTAPITKEQLLPKINQFMQSYLQNWNSGVCDLQQKSNEVVMLLILKMVASTEESSSLTNELEKELHHFSHGVFCLPLNLPGTTYNRALQARKKLVTMFGEMIDERRRSTCRKNDMLDTLLKSEDCDNNRTKLSDEQIIDLTITFIYSGYETVSSLLMMVVKYLQDHPDAQQQLRRENLEIRNGKDEDYMISWQDYKSMTFTRAVILESLRVSSLSAGTMRKSTVDTTIKGHVIPEGWPIFLYTGEVSHDPDIYPDPLNFNPSRWLDGNLESHQYFLPFGCGTRVCPGKELGILEISIFLHYLVTKYRWEEVGENKMVYFPRVEAPNGLHFRFSEF